MKEYRNCLLGLAIGAGLFCFQVPGLAKPSDPQSAGMEVKLMNKEKESVGTAKLRETPHGVLIHLTITKLPEGTHAFHIHETGQCNPPDFKSAGGHLNPTKQKHGLLDPKGFHLGDLPNIHIVQNGKAEMEIFVPEATLQQDKKSLLDDDGASLVVHEGQDDYKTDPAGDAGPRIACGTIEKS